MLREMPNEIRAELSDVHLVAVYALSASQAFFSRTVGSFARCLSASVEEDDGVQLAGKSTASRMAEEMLLVPCIFKCIAIPYQRQVCSHAHLKGTSYFEAAVWQGKRAHHMHPD